MHDREHGKSMNAWCKTKNKHKTHCDSLELHGKQVKKAQKFHSQQVD